MATRDQILDFCNDYLQVESFEDYGPNGLQVIGKDKIQKIITGVSVSQDLCSAAIDRKADMILVHHGEFWSGADQRITQVRKNRLLPLLSNDINLVAYHLPLDAHREIGNNAQLCTQLGFELSDEKFAEFQKQSIGVIGTHSGKKITDLVEELDRLLSTRSLVFSFGPDTVHRIGFVSGGGADELHTAIEKELDTFITGESKESTFHTAKEAGVNLIYAHHYNSEKLGIQALGQLIETRFKVTVEFVDIPCPL